MQVITSLQTDNHASTTPLRVFYRPDALPAAQPTVKALKARHCSNNNNNDDCLTAFDPGQPG